MLLSALLFLLVVMRAPHPCCSLSASLSALFQPTPHSSFHYDSALSNPQRLSRGKNFFEGWYFRLCIDEGGNTSSYVLIVSLENNGGKSGTCVQVIGPAEDYYLTKVDGDITKFRAGGPNEFSLTLGDGSHVNAKQESVDVVLTSALPGDRSPYGATGGGHSFRFNLTSILPVYGWGDQGGQQKSTAGWLARYSLFDPHWQITMSSGLANGTVEWDGADTREFVNAKFYAEKNWGSAFPQKWYWVQCNTFDSPHSDLCVTAGGGVRDVSIGPMSQTEELGMVGVHWEGRFYEFVPWAGEMEWEVDVWGRWKFVAEAQKEGIRYGCELLATCDGPGVTIRVPTADGLELMCRDSLSGVASLSLWEVAEDGSKGRMIVDNATTNSCGVEVGGPYDGDWKAKSSMSRLVKALKIAGASGTSRDEARRRIEELQRKPALALRLSEKEFKALLGVLSVPRDFKSKWMENNAFLVYYSKGFDGIGRPSIEIESELEKLSAEQAGMRTDLWYMIDDGLRFGDVKEEEVSAKLANFLKTVIN